MKVNLLKDALCHRVNINTGLKAKGILKSQLVSIFRIKSRKKCFCFAFVDARRIISPKKARPLERKANNRTELKEIILSNSLSPLSYLVCSLSQFVKGLSGMAIE